MDTDERIDAEAQLVLRMRDLYGWDDDMTLTRAGQTASRSEDGPKVRARVQELIDQGER